MNLVNKHVSPKGKRVLAFLVDLIVIGLIRMSLLLTYVTVIQALLPADKYLRLLKHIEGLDFLLSLVLIFGYFTLNQYMGSGRTVGKVIFGLQTICIESLRPPDLKQCCLRAIGYVICYIPAGLLFLIGLLRKDGLGLPDFLSSSYTVDQKKFESIIASNFKIEVIECPIIETASKVNKTG